MESPTRGAYDTKQVYDARREPGCVWLLDAYSGHTGVATASFKEG